MRRGLVLGCGGPLGMAWSVSALREIEREWDWDAREADTIVGTSAGAELACLLGGGVPLSDVYGAHLGDPAAPPWLTDHLRVDAGRFPGRPAARIGSPRLLRRALAGQAPLLAGLTAALPVGRGDPSWLRRLADRMATRGEWVAHPSVWLVAADYDTGERIAFGSPGAPRATLADALAASWALPTWLPPVTIAGRRYVDGGVLSPASADLLAPAALDEVVVLAPMASSRPGRATGALARAERIVRRQMTRALDREVERLAASGARVWRLEPAERDLSVMGGNFMDARRRTQTLDPAAVTARETLAGAAA